MKDGLFTEILFFDGWWCSVSVVTMYIYFISLLLFEAAL